MRTAIASIFMRLLIRNIILVFLIISSIYSQDLSTTKNQPINSHWGAGLEYANNCEIGILGQFNLNDNISFLLKVRRCTHDKKIYFLPEVKYYFDKRVYDILPYIDIRFGKLHYDLSWSSTYITYDNTIEYVWDASMGQMVPMVVPSYSASSASGSTIINTPALSISGGGEYLINNIGLNAAIGMSHYTKIDVDSKDKNKFFFTIESFILFSINQGGFCEISKYINSTNTLKIKKNSNTNDIKLQTSCSPMTHGSMYFYHGYEGMN